MLTKLLMRFNPEQRLAPALVGSDLPSGPGTGKPHLANGVALGGAAMARRESAQKDAKITKS